MSNSITKFLPPFLRMDNTENINKVKGITADFVKKSRLMHPISVSNTPKLELNLASFIAEDKTEDPISKPKKEAKNFTSKKSLSNTSVKIPDIKIADGINLRTAALPINITPSGNVSLGFNCLQEFDISVNMPGDFFQWYIGFKDTSGSYSGLAQYIGTTNNNSAKFSLDQSSYLLHTFIISGVDTVTFKIFCGIILAGVSYPPLALTSDEVTLKFNTPSCIGIHSASLSADTFRGGLNDREPTLTITLDAPAPPSGQIVELSVSNTNLGSIMGSGNFNIPSGQISGSISWFLGTRRVYSTGKKFNIIAKVNNSKSYSEITLNKQNG